MVTKVTELMKKKIISESSSLDKEFTIKRKLPKQNPNSCLTSLFLAFFTVFLREIMSFYQENKKFEVKFL